MTTMREVRRLALALPEAVEQDHHGMASFRVRSKIYATVPDERHVRIMVAEPEVLAALAEDPASCRPLHWGKRLAGVEVTVRTASAQLVGGLLADAWYRRAPAALRRELDSP